MNRITIVRRGIGTLIRAAIGLGFIAPVFGADPTDVPMKNVKFGDLNLSTPEGAATLYTRISIAAKRVCSPLDSRALESKADHFACVRKAIVDAVIKVNEPALLVAYNKHNTTPLPTTLVSRTP